LLKETRSKEYQATIYGQAGFKIGWASRPTVVVRSRAKRAREKDISLNASKENSKRLRQGQLEQITGAKVEAVQVQVPSRQEELLARRLKDKETRAAKKRRKALKKIQAEANRVNSERFMQGYLGNRRIEPLEKGVTPKGDG
jgi:hypothetical protein